ncbi:MAG TPA: hypothetical protein VF779_07520 [Pyrinomonadaceae bacterium]
MNHYQKIAFVVIRVSGYLGILIAVREFLESIFYYVVGGKLGLLPSLYFNERAGIYVGFFILASSLLTIAISKPLAIHIGGYFDADSSGE